VQAIKVLNYENQTKNPRAQTNASASSCSTGRTLANPPVPLRGAQCGRAANRATYSSALRPMTISRRAS